MLQPKEKSFGYYIMKGYEFSVNKTTKNTKILKSLKNLSNIDDSILIIDDILDNSQTRNGKPCLYKSIGTEKAIIKAELLKTIFVSDIINIMKELKTKEKYQIEILNKINQFLMRIYKGQAIDIELGDEKKISTKSIRKYFKMISLFTGGHIQFGLEIGQLIANKKPNKNISKIAISLGIIRQIYDDFYDYFPGHHEPFGDFMTNNNRLPELLFKLKGGNRNKIETMIKNNEVEKARDVVLNNEIRKWLYSYCIQEINKIKHIQTTFDFSKMIVDYENILTK